MVREPQQALDEARRTLQGLKIPSQKDLDRLEKRLKELTERVEAMAETIGRLEPGRRTSAKPRSRKQ